MDTETQQIITTAIAAFIRHGLTVVAGSLVTLGWIQNGQTNSFVEMGSGIVIGALVYLWSLYQKRGLAGMLAALHMANNDPRTPPEVKQVVAAAIAKQK